ncbi:reverse transcriptase (RNA-dependent DNA polymerase) [Alloalcanivorax xenomutans]|uniref:reverse transcriptase family protein n=1 Tax=Alloalcanivorax xenomutans TaxID=1094342 RepID=UPI000BD968AD|nr:reverse transcriptase family protein [Alloalcanivorax xenomutans]SOC04520.1 reverse transcriptase (RNA-dependent DNA polymerase) [Alloalcanivorax xenomutans]
MDKPYYPHNGISSIQSLAKTLGIHPSLLVDIASKTTDSYTEFQITSKNGKIRTVYDPKYELKRIQKNINQKILEKVEYPTYLQGGIRDLENRRSYVDNAGIHAGSNHILSLDIKNFYDNIRPEKVKEIFLYFFKFSDETSELLTKLVTLGNKVPQGACTSSYIANLVFFNSEYRIFSELKSKGISYSRLLDDVTLSSRKHLSRDEASEHIRLVCSIFKKNGLRLNNKKTKNELKGSNPNFKVTGLWVEHKNPKIPKKERHHTRHLVYICEKEYAKSPSSEHYHQLWNKTSGQVAKLKQLGHSQHKQLRTRLKKILPILDESSKKKLILDCKKLLHLERNAKERFGVLKRINKCIYMLGILSRSDKGLSSNLRRQLLKHFGDLPTHKDYWI